MSQIGRLSTRDLEALSAFLDGQLTAAEAARLEIRLEREPQLREALEELRWTSTVLRTLPTLPVPRSFAIKPAAAPVRRAPRGYPLLQLSTAIAGIALAAVVGFDVLSVATPLRNLAVQEAASEAPAEPGVEMFAAQLAETSTPRVAGEEEAYDRLPAPEGTVAPGLLAAAPTPYPTEVKTLPSATLADDSYRSAPAEGAAIEEAVAADEVGWPAIRYIEIALGVVTVLLGGLTLAARRRSTT
jgi:hypothetical protein